MLEELIWSSNPDKDSWEAIEDQLGNYAQEYLGEAGISVVLAFPDMPAECSLSGPVRYQLLCVLKEACRNIVKHAQASEVILTLCCK